MRPSISSVMDEQEVLSAIHVSITFQTQPLSININDCYCTCSSGLHLRATLWKTQTAIIKHLSEDADRNNWGTLTLIANLSLTNSRPHISKSQQTVRKLERIRLYLTLIKNLSASPESLTQEKTLKNDTFRKHSLMLHIRLGLFISFTNAGSQLHALWFLINQVIVREAEQLDASALVFLSGLWRKHSVKSLPICTHFDVLLFAHIQKWHLLI